MRKVGFVEAKRKWSELVEWAGGGEEIGITKRGKLAAVIGPAPAHDQLEEILDGMERIRKHAKPLRAVIIKDLIEERQNVSRFVGTHRWHWLGLLTETRTPMRKPCCERYGRDRGR